MSPDEQETPTLLVVLTGADQWTLADGTRHPTGSWVEEFVEPMKVFPTAGLDVTVATPGVFRPPVLGDFQTPHDLLERLAILLDLLRQLRRVSGSR